VIQYVTFFDSQLTADFSFCKVEIQWGFFTTSYPCVGSLKFFPTVQSIGCKGRIAEYPRPAADTALHRLLWPARKGYFDCGLSADVPTIRNS
jgi:hypothetical protein